ncbi:MAG: type II and III secretion system protein family protein [Pseudomonadota bacterium]
MKSFLTYCIAILFLVTGISTPVCASKENPDSLSPKQLTETLYVTLGKAEIYNFSEDVADILVADPQIADVMALQTDKLFVVGAKLGDTNIIAMDNAGNLVKRVNVHVRIDTVALEGMIHSLFPKETNVNLQTVGKQLILSGQVSNPAVAQKIANVVSSHIADIRGGAAGANPNSLIENLLEVRGEQQVTLRVRVVEMSRDVIRQLGVETNINQQSPTSSGRLTGGVSSNGALGFLEESILSAGLVWDSGVTGLGFVEFLIQALERDNLANVLAEPNLTALSGEEAGFLAGGEFPVPVGRDNEGNIIIEFKDFGVSLNFKPLVMNEDRINLQMKTEVSSLDFQKGVTLEDTEIPGIDVRRASTTVELGSGSSLMIAGLIKSEAIKGISGLPGIKNTPILGDLVSSRRFNREETELVVIVTPYLVKPFADTKQVEAPAAPAPTPMGEAFVNNLRRNFKGSEAALPPAGEKFGYMID